jgi:hypothetical protein
MYNKEQLAAATTILMSCFTDLELFSSRMYQGERYANTYYPGNSACDVEKADGTSYTNWKEFAADVVAKHFEANRLVQFVMNIEGKKTTLTISHIHDDKISWRLQVRTAFNPALALADSVEKASKSNPFINGFVPTSSEEVAPVQKKKLLW